jgi:hypothetical protein
MKPCIFVQHAEDGYIISGERKGTPIRLTVSTLKEVEDFLMDYQGGNDLA